LSDRLNKTIVVKMATAIEIGKSRSHYLLAESVYPANKLDAPTGNLDVVANLRSVRDIRPARRGG
jgi:hypothetical protein